MTRVGQRRVVRVVRGQPQVHSEDFVYFLRRHGGRALEDTKHRAQHHHPRRCRNARLCEGLHHGQASAPRDPDVGVAEACRGVRRGGGGVLPACTAAGGAAEKHTLRRKAARAREHSSWEEVYAGEPARTEVLFWVHRHSAQRNSAPLQQAPGSGGVALALATVKTCLTAGD